MARRWFTEVIIILTLGIIAAVMFKNIDLRPVPGPDVFQYIHDSQYYLNFSLPNNIHSPPGNPILIGLISKTIDNPRREVLTAIGINIITSMLIVYLTWRIFQGLYGNFSLLLPLLLLTNALTYSTGLDSTSEVLFTALVLFCIYVYPKHKNVAFLLAGLTFLVRYEAVVLVLALIVTEIYNKTALHAPVKRILLGVIPIVVWVGIINFQNSTGNLVGNEFIQEIIRRSNELPTLKIVTRIPNALLVSISMDSWISLFILLYVIFGMVFLLRRGGRQLALYFIFFLGYILIHLVFPSFSFRYLLPIFPFTYVACLWPLKLKTSNYWQRVIGIIMIVLTIVVAKENVLAIGDNYNDKEMVEEAGISVSADKSRLKADYFVLLDLMLLERLLLL